MPRPELDSLARLVMPSLMALACLACEAEHPALPASPPPTEAQEPAAQRVSDEPADPTPSLTGAPTSTALEQDPSAEASNIQTLMPSVEGAVPAGPVTSLECRGGEASARWQRFNTASALAEAVVSLGAAGHREWTYHFRYEHGDLVSAVHRVASWSFAPDGEPEETRDTVVRRLYHFEEDDRCEAQRAVAAHADIEAKLDAVEARTIECHDAARVKALGQQAARPSEGVPGWLNDLCLKDPSSGLKL